MCESHVYREIVGFKCEWFSLTSALNECSVEYIRDVTHISNALRFLMKMWRFPLLWSWSIDLLLLSIRSLGLPNK
jgi:hypothetical protein